MSVPAEVESLLADSPVSAHLATSVDDRPHVAPVWYGYREGTCYFLTGGRKLANVRHNSRVALSVESAEGGDVAWHVTLLGTATVSDDPERIAWAEGWIYDRYRGDGDDESAAEAEDGATDTGETADGSGDGDAAAGDTGGSGDAGGVYALVSVAVGSAYWSVYE